MGPVKDLRSWRITLSVEKIKRVRDVARPFSVSPEDLVSDGITCLGGNSDITFYGCFN